MTYSIFKQLSLLGVILALCVVSLGAYVRLSDAGLGCPDWPGCYGTLTVPESEAAIKRAQAAYPNAPVETGKAWKEMSHRYLAGTLGFIVLGLFLLSLRRKQGLKVSTLLTAALLALIIFQAILGMWTVTMLLKPVIVSAHLLGGMATLGLLTWVAHRHWGSVNGEVSTNLKLAVRLGVLALFTQIFLGGWTSSNYAALACTDFPTCHGKWMPDMDFKEAFHIYRELGQSANGEGLTLSALTAIQWTHRLGAIIVLIYMSWLTMQLFKNLRMKTLAMCLLVLVLLQIAIGIANLVLHLPLMLAVAHNLGAALSVVTLVVINSKITPYKNNDIEKLRA